MTRFRRFRLARGGAIAVETAFVLTLVLLPTLFGLLDFMLIYQNQAAVDEAVHDAMTYVMNAGSSATSSAIQTAAQASTSASITVSTSTVCYCAPDGTTTPTMPTSVSCSGSCSSSFVFQTFMRIVTSGQVAIPLPLSWVSLPSPYTTTAIGFVRTG